MRKSRYAIAAVAAAALATGCRPAADQGSNNNAADPSEATRPAIVPAPEPPLDREALLLAVVRAAGAAAAGATDSAAQRELDGKRFELKLSLGCPTELPVQAKSTEGRAGSEKASARLSARPDVSLDDPLIRALANVAEFEAVEGFAIERPWLLRAACPQPSPPAAQAGAEETSKEREPQRGRDRPAPATEAAPNPPQQRIVIAEFFTSTDARTGRRSNRPFEAVVTADQARDVARTGFNLVLAGRLRPLADGRVIACRVVDAARPPDCLISADFDQVRMEQPVTGTVLARWAD